MRRVVIGISESGRFPEGKGRGARDDLVAAYPPPEWDVTLSLPAVHATAMVLVDYALGGSSTPTAWPHAVASRVPAAVKSEWMLLRPIVAHGTVWRDFVLFRLGRDDAAQHEWRAYREWTARLPDEEMQALVVEGVLSGLRYYRENMKPMPEVEDCLAAVGTRAPDRQVLAERNVLPTAVRALAASWGAPVEAVPELAAHPPRLRRALLRMMDAVWELGFGRLWTERLPRLRRAAVAATRRLEEAAAPRRSGAGGGGAAVPAGVDELVLAATGRQLASSVLDRMRSASRVVFFPGLELGQFISVEEAGYGWPEHERPGEWRVFYDPLAVPRAAGGPGSPGRGTAPALPGDLAESSEPDDGSEPGPALDFDTAAAGLAALGDPTRLAVVLALQRDGEMFAGEVAERLGVHPSTASRHLAQLEAAGLVRVRRDGKLKFYAVEADKIQAIGAFLRQRFRPEGP